MRTIHLTAILNAPMILALVSTPANSAPCPVYNITALPYGANGTDLLDDSTAIQAALDDAKNCIATCGCGGAKVYVPPGRFYAANLKIASNITLLGEGVGVSRLTLPASTASSTHLLINDGWSSPLVWRDHITIRGITFDGNKASQTDGNNHNGINFKRVTDFDIHHCEFLGFESNGVVLQEGTTRGALEQCLSHTNGSTAAANGFLFQAGSGGAVTDLRVSGCEARDNTLNGFSANNAEALTFVDCLASGNGGSNTSAYGFAAHSVRNSTYAGCIARSNTRYGFGATDAGSGSPAGLTFAGCVSEANGFAGFHLSSCTGVSLTGCAVRANGISASATDVVKRSGIAVVSSTTNLTIANGTVLSNDGHGIYIENSTAGTISDLVIMNNSQDTGSNEDGILLSGSSRYMITGCMVADDQATKSQYRAIESVSASTATHVFTNDVAGNVALDPVVLTGTNQVDHNPGDI